MNDRTVRLRQRSALPGGKLSDDRSTVTVTQPSFIIAVPSKVPSMMLSGRVVAVNRPGAGIGFVSAGVACVHAAAPSRHAVSMRTDRVTVGPLRRESPLQV